MEHTHRALKRTERLLRRYRLSLEDIESFRFMERYTPVPHQHSKLNKYGPGILTLKLRDGQERVIILHSRHCPTDVLRAFLAKGISMTNCQQPHTTAGVSGVAIYRRPSLYQFWYAMLMTAFFVMGFWLLMDGPATGRVLAATAFFGLSIYLMYLLLTRFCYLDVRPYMMYVCSNGRRVKLEYETLRKVNFDFAREPGFTHVMEVLKNDYSYHLYYMGRVPRKKLNEIAERLRMSGVDATCSLNDAKRHYEDVFHVH